MIDKLLVSFGLKYLAAKMDGYKSYSGAAGKIIGGVVSILTGITGTISYMYPESELPDMDIETILGLFGGGFYAISSGIQGIGLAHKLGKATETKEISK